MECTYYLLDTHPNPSFLDPPLNCSTTVIPSDVFDDDAETAVPGYLGSLDLHGLGVSITDTGLRLTAICGDGMCTDGEMLYVGLGFDEAECNVGVLGGGSTLSLPCLTTRLELNLGESTATVHDIIGPVSSLSSANVSVVRDDVQVEWHGPLEWFVTSLAPTNLTLLTMAAELVGRGPTDYLPELYAVGGIDVSPYQPPASATPSPSDAIEFTTGGNPTSSSGLDISVLLIVLVSAGILLTIGALVFFSRSHHLRHRLMIHRAKKKSSQSTGARRGHGEHLVSRRSV
jgi:hypothetical protein